MKTALLFLTIACALPGGSYATTTGDAKPQQNAKPPVQAQGHSRATEKKRESVPTTLPKPANPRRTPNNLKHAATGDTRNARGRVSDQWSSVTNAGPAQGHSVLAARPVRPSTVSRTSVPSQSNVWHRGANPATVGGPRNASVARSGTLDGRGVSRRP